MTSSGSHHRTAAAYGALMFGSSTIGEGDAFSDIEFAVFIQNDLFEDFDQRSRLDAVSLVAAYFPELLGEAVVRQNDA